MSELNRRLLFIILIVLLKILLEIIYVYYISPVYSYMGFNFSPDPGRFIVSYIIVVVLATVFPEKTITLSRILWSYMFIVLYIPVSSLYWMDRGFSSSYFFTLTLIVLIINLMLNFKAGINLRFSPLFSFDKFLLFVIIIDLLFLVVLFKHYGVVIRKVSLSNVYQIREVFKETSSKLINYFINWAGNVINPYLFIYGFESGKFLFLLFALLFQYYIFSLTGFRSLFFSLLFVFVMVLGVKFAEKKFHIFLALLLSLWTAFVIFINLVIPSKGVLVASIGVRRPLFLPALVGNYYWEFFSENRKDHFSRNFPFKYFFHPEYQDNVPFVIGEQFFHKKVHANANFVADAYANFGYAGVTLVVIMFMFLLKFIDDFSQRKRLSLLVGLTGMSIFSLTNMSFITVMMTHGFLLALFIMFIHPESENA